MRDELSANTWMIILNSYYISNIFIDDQCTVTLDLVDQGQLPIWEKDLPEK